MVTIRSDAELCDAYTLVEEMGARFMKMMVTDGIEDASFAAPTEDFEKMDLEEVVSEAPQEEAKIDTEEPEKCKKPWKKFKKHGKFMRGKFLNNMVGTLRQVIREELNYALKGEVPPEPVAPQAVHHRVQCDFCDVAPIIGNRYKCMTCPNFDLCQACYEGPGHEHEMVEINTPQMCTMAMDINVGDLQGFNFKNFAKQFNKLKKPKFEVTESTKVKKTVSAGEQ